MHRCMEKRRTLTWLVVLAMPVLLVSYGWFMNHRPALHVKASTIYWVSRCPAYAYLRCTDPEFRSVAVRDFSCGGGTAFLVDI